MTEPGNDRTLLEAIPAIVWRADATGAVTYWNQRWYEYTGLDPADSTGLSAISAVHPDDQDRTLKQWSEAIAKGEPFEIEQRLQRQDGVYHWFISRAVPIRNREGQITDWFGTITNIDEQKRLEAKLLTEILDRQRIEQELRSANQRVTNILESMTDAFATLDHNWRFIYANQAALNTYRALTQLEPEEVIGKSHWEVFPMLMGQPVEREYRRAMAERVAVHLEVFYEPTGNWFEAHAYPCVEGLSIYFRDISDRKQAELDLQQQQITTYQQFAELTAIYETAPIGLAILDRDLRFVRLNQRLAEINGISVDDHIGRSVREIVPNIADTVEPLFRRVLETEEPLLNLEISGETVAQPGVQRTWIENWFPLRDPETGQVIGINAVVQEITERKQTESDLQDSERRLQLAKDAANLGIHDYNITTGEIDWDLRTRELWGVEPNEPITLETFLDSLHPDDRAPTQAALEQALAPNNGQYAAEYRVIHRKDGKTRWVAATGIVIFDQDRPSRLVGTVQDISDRKQAEQEREQLLAQEQAAREAAEHANRIKDEFLAILSHELRSPLNPILGWSKLLRSRRLPPDQTDKALATIERNAQLQTQLIDDLLDMARILRGKLSLNPVPVNLATVVDAAIETVRTAAIAKSISLHANLSQPSQVMGDAARLQQIVWNLLSNAIKFTPNHGQVRIQLHPIDDQVELIVTDTGKGIRSDFLPHLFESFRQEDASVTRQYGGLGLGLAIARQLVEAHGGTIHATSPGEGLGSTFTLRLPLLETPAEIAPSPSSELDLNLTGIRVLAIDDDPDARDLLKTILTEYGAEVLMATSAPEAIAALTSFQPNLLISDIGMPEVSGYDLIQQIRAIVSSEKLPAIALTAYASLEDQNRAIACGYQFHLSKPLDPNQLIAAIQAFAPSKS